MIHERDPEPEPELEEIARLLDEVAAQEDLEREEADALLKAPGQERVESSLREAWSTPARSAARPWIRRLAVLGAAAAVAVYVGWRFAER